MIPFGVNNKKRMILGYKFAESIFRNYKLLLNLNIFGFLINYI